MSEDWRDYAKRTSPTGYTSTSRPAPPILETPPAPVAKSSGRGTREADRMNRLETRYAEHLELRRVTGEIRSYRYEPWKLRLAAKTYYNFDFSVVMPDGSIELHEVKGHWEDDARVKIKCAADKFDEFKFVAVKWKKNQGWIFEEFK